MGARFDPFTTSAYGVDNRARGKGCKFGGQVQGNLQMPCLHVQGPLPGIATQQPQGPCFQFGAGPPPAAAASSNDMVSVVWEGKPYPMPAALARQMNLQPVQAQQFM